MPPRTTLLAVHNRWEHRGSRGVAGVSRRRAAIDCASGPPAARCYSTLSPAWCRGGCVVPKGLVRVSDSCSCTALLVERDSSMTELGYQFHHTAVAAAAAAARRRRSGARRRCGTRRRSAAAATAAEQQQQRSKNAKMEAAACWC